MGTHFPLTHLAVVFEAKLTGLEINSVPSSSPALTTKGLLVLPEQAGLSRKG